MQLRLARAPINRLSTNVNSVFIITVAGLVVAIVAMGTPPRLDGRQPQRFGAFQSRVGFLHAPSSHADGRMVATDHRQRRRQIDLNEIRFRADRS